MGVRLGVGVITVIGTAAVTRPEPVTPSSFPRDGAVEGLKPEAVVASADLNHII